MIAVSQGYEKSISIEVFIKAFLVLNKSEQEKIIYFCHKSSVVEYLKNFNYHFEILDNQIIFSDFSILIIHDCVQDPTQTSSCLISAIEFCIKKNAKLLTMPSRKDQFFLNGKLVNGHTGFLREYFQEPLAYMTFFSEEFNVALMTEHIALSQVSVVLNEAYLFNKLNHILSTYPYPIEQIYISGINPHCGENGLYGNEDIFLSTSIQKLRIKFPQFTIIGPVSGDTLALKLNANNLGIYMYHDQALSFFKHAAGKYGLNITVGLPIERISVDHGTAEDIYLNNYADYSSTLYALKFLTKKSPSKN